MMVTPGRIAVCVPSFRSGGAERVALNLVEGFVERGIAVDVVVADAQGPLAHDVPPAAVVVDLGCERVAKAVWPMARYFRSVRPDLVVSHVHHLNLATVLARALSRSACPLVLVEHNTLGEKSRGGQVRLGLRRALAWAYRRPGTRVVAVSEGVADSLADELRLPRAAIEVIANPVIGGRFERRSGEAVEHRWLQDRNAPLLLAVGRLVPQKDFALLLTAFARFRQRRPARLLVLGDGPLRGELQAQRDALPCAEDIEFAGYVDNPLPYYRHADLTVLASRFEGLPTVLIEALASGCPCAATDCPSGPREILSDGRFGLLSPVGDAGALAASMDRALALGGDRAALIARGREYRVSKAVERYLALGSPAGARAA